MNTQAVVVLGGAGLIGSLISRILKQYGYIVRVVDQRHRPDSPVNQTAGSRLGC